MATVRIPSPLRKYTNGQSKVQGNGGTVTEVLDNLEIQFPGIKTRLYDDNNQIKRYVNVFVNDDEIRTLQGEATQISEKDVVSIVPAMAGGR